MSERNEMDIKKVKELIALMKENDLIELELADGRNKVHLKRPGPQMPVFTPMPMVPGSTPQPATPPIGSVESPVSASTSKEDLVEITSPIIGTLYSAPSPDSESYVSVGDKVKPDTIVCIVEAMKVMNEIKAGVSGTIVEILCQAGQPVEFGQTLFRVRP
ncbi:MAG: acetyl-CoA carboxylase biotin carboxyl carrier protein [Sedimentisphaerales bacterium]|nr:acetyl-CoA carboxylase biotin carboxyl carrier protein [Sedimentisphaerales bacterium]